MNDNNDNNDWFESLQKEIKKNKKAIEKQIEILNEDIKEIKEEKKGDI